ncbi:MAG: glycosyltransferase family A protein [Planctomycetota bacterium]|jgi:glycosyltransferase involved in cell wall biosynthesis
MVSDQLINIIIPTLATKERGPFLERALTSALAQEKLRTLPIVVSNGSSCCPEVLNWIKKRSDIRYAHLEEASLPKALLAGRELVDTRYFAELDDDDILLPHAMISRFESLSKSENIDAVVSNGFFYNNGKKVISHPDITACQDDPLESVVKYVWLNPGAALFRTSAVEANVFAEMPQYLEWTYLALRLSFKKRLLFIDNPSFVHYLNLPFSIWRSESAISGLPRALRRILTLDLPKTVRAEYEKRLANACHSASRVCLKKNKYSSALDWQIKSLRTRFNVKLLPYAFYLLLRRGFLHNQ